MLVLASYTPPDRREFAGFTLCRLSPRFDHLDFAAVAANADRIRYVFGPHNSWPDPSMSFEENLADLQRHDQEFADRKAFAYALLSSDESRYLGCLYIKPIKSRIENDRRMRLFDAQVFFWLDADAEASALAPMVEYEVRRWLADEWPLKVLAFPGRAITWKEWEDSA